MVPTVASTPTTVAPVGGSSTPVTVAAQIHPFATFSPVNQNVSEFSSPGGYTPSRHPTAAPLSTLYRQSLRSFHGQPEQQQQEQQPQPKVQEQQGETNGEMVEVPLEGGMQADLADNEGNF